MTPSFLPSSFEITSTGVFGHADTFDVSLITRPPCPTCHSAMGVVSRGKLQGKPWAIYDLPRTRPTQLRVTRRRWECSTCLQAKLGPKTFTDRGPDTHAKYNITTRLHRYLLSILAVRSISEIHAETGVPTSTLWDMAIRLSKFLEDNHRFATPSVLAIDGIKIGKHEYMVLADGLTGLPVGFLDSIKAPVVARWILKRLDTPSIKFLVADLHKTNTSIARTKLPKALFIADKWHVLRRYQAVLSQIINKEINQLRLAGRAAEAKTLYDFKPGLMAVDKRRRKTRRTIKGGQRQLNFMDDLVSVLGKHKTIKRAFWARQSLMRFYSRPTRKEALPWLRRFLRQTDTLPASPKLTAFRKLIWTNRKTIRNYFASTSHRGGGKWRGITTNNLERHNAEIRKRIRVRHGVRNFEYLRLIAVYGANRIGNDVLICDREGCKETTEKVFGPVATPAIRDASGVYWTCTAHA